MLDTLRKRYSGKWPLIISFSLIYSFSVLAISLLFRFFPTGVSLENQLFDRIQQHVVIDSKSDFTYNKYADYLEELTLINLDSHFFNLETNRIDKQKLAIFLARINQQSGTPKAVFLDYANTIVSDYDSLLYKEFDHIQDRLVLPMSFEINGELAREGDLSKITADRIEKVQLPLYQNAKLGFVFPMTDPYTHSNRYFKYMTDDQQYFSVPWQLYQLSDHYQPGQLEQFNNDIKEFKFILRNKDILGEERAVDIYDASDILNGQMPDNYLNSIINNKVLVIGLFDDYRTKYNNTIDKFVTPVQADMSGALLLTNAYLNLSADIEIKNHNWIIFFLINLLVGIFMAMNYEKNISSHYIALITMGINTIISIVFFFLISFSFYVFFNIKMGLGIALLIYQKKYYIINWYQNWYASKYPHAEVLEMG